jgi:hypothetical protein
VNPTDHLDRGSALRGVRGVIERLVRDGTAVARSDGTLHDLFPVAASAAEGEALRGWVVSAGATQTIEVGLGYGISALHICEGLLANADPAARHVVVDPYQATRFSNCGLCSSSRKRGRGAGRTPSGGVPDRATALPRRSLALRPSVRRRQPPLRRSLRRPLLPRTSRATGRDRVLRRLPASCGRAGGVLLSYERGLETRGGLGLGRPPPVGRPPHLRDPRHATLRLLRRLLRRDEACILPQGVILRSNFRECTFRDCMKEPQTQAKRLTMRRLIAAAYTNASPLAHSLS